MTELFEFILLLWHGTLSELLALCEEDTPTIAYFPSQKANDTY